MFSHLGENVPFHKKKFSASYTISRGRKSYRKNAIFNLLNWKFSFSVKFNLSSPVFENFVKRKGLNFNPTRVKGQTEKKFSEKLRFMLLTLFWQKNFC